MIKIKEEQNPSPQLEERVRISKIAKFGREML
jgi:hypothetical protein